MKDFEINVGEQGGRTHDAEYIVKCAAHREMKDANADQSDSKKRRGESRSVEVPIHPEAQAHGQQGNGKNDLEDTLGRHKAVSWIVRNSKLAYLITAHQQSAWKQSAPTAVSN